jgi:hypothetical protein
MATSYTGQFLSQLGGALPTLLNQRKQEAAQQVQQQRRNTIEDEDRAAAKEKASKDAVLDEIIKGLKERELKNAQYDDSQRDAGDKAVDEFDSSKRISTLPISPEYALTPPKQSADSPVIPTSFNPPKYELPQPGMSDMARADKYSLSRYSKYSPAAAGVLGKITDDQSRTDAITKVKDQNEFSNNQQDKNIAADMDRLKYSQGQENYRAGLAANSTNKAQKQDFTQENQLRTQFDGMAKEFIGTRDAYKRIKSATSNVSPAGDLALIYNYMKMLDPGSTVRESEFATAAAAGSYGDRFKGAAEKLISGKRLSDDQRKDFMNSTEELYTQQRESFGQLKDKYSKIATEYGLSPDRVTGGIDFEAKPDAKKYSDAAIQQAKEAMNDPSAPEAVKAKARKVLGL